MKGEKADTNDNKKANNALPATRKKATKNTKLTYTRHHSQCRGTYFNFQFV